MAAFFIAMSLLPRPNGGWTATSAERNACGTAGVASLLPFHRYFFSGQRVAVREFDPVPRENILVMEKSAAEPGRQKSGGLQRFLVSTGLLQRCEHTKGGSGE